MASKSKPPSRATTAYLLLYNLLSLTLWAILTSRLFFLLAIQQVPITTTTAATAAAAAAKTPAVIFDALFPLLQFTQSLAGLEILHSLFRLVRASVVTTTMQVLSRILVVWGVMYLFSVDALGEARGIVGSGGAAAAGNRAQGHFGDWAFIGCLTAWGVTECVRYGYFVLQLSGMGVPPWVSWLRYNLFFVLYPLGISSECSLVYKAITPARDIHPAFAWTFIVILFIYVPGSYILYTHMMSQRRKVMRAQAEKKAN